MLWRSLIIVHAAFAQDAPQPPKSCDNIQVRGQGVRQTVDRVKARANTICGEDGKSGQVAAAAEQVNRQLDKCVVPWDGEYNISLRETFKPNQHQRAQELCANLKKDLDTVDQFCAKQARVRQTAQATIEATAAGDSGNRPNTSTDAGQYQLHQRMTSAYSYARDSAVQFHKLTEQLKAQLASRRRQGAQSNPNAAHSEDELMRRQETFFLQAPARRATLFTQMAGTEKDPARKAQLLAAVQACRAAAQPNSPVVQFRQAMENHLLPNHENLFKMSNLLEEQAKADVTKAESDLASAGTTRDRFKSEADARRVAAADAARVRGPMPAALEQPVVRDMANQPVVMREETTPVSLARSPLNNPAYEPLYIRTERVDGRRMPTQVEYYRYRGDGKIYRYIR